MSKRLVSTAAALSAGVFVLSMALGSAGAAMAREIKLAHLAPTNDPRHGSLVKFAKAIEARTKGELTVKIFPNSTLGKDREVFEQLQGGLTELALMARSYPTFTTNGR